jgi:hypothetical protein
MNIKILLSVALGASLTILQLTAQTSIESTRAVIDQWVQTKQLTSKEQSDWRLEKSILTDTEQLLNNELQRLDLALEALQGSASAADEERSELNAQKEAITEATSVVEHSIRGLETQIKAIVATLPPPLIEKIKPLVHRLPEDSTKTTLSLGERLQNIVGILNQADKFNRTITQTSETRTLDNGKIIEVRTLYWGLAMAYYVDTSGAYAGIGYPDKNGWQWPQMVDAGPQIKQLFEVYEGNEPIQFIDLPARIH